MIIVRLWGGLGNQMFQYACGYALGKRNNTEIALDTRFFTEDYLKKNKHFSRQELNIMEFPIQYKKQVNTFGELKHICGLQNRTCSRIIRLPRRFSIKIDGIQYEKETRLTYLPYINNIKCQDLYLDGYWQSVNYFKDFSEEIRAQFKRSSNVASRYISSMNLHATNTVAIHLRLGDYVSNKKFMKHYNYIVPPSYYLNAIREMKKKIEHPIFYVFSNNMKKAQAMLGYSKEIIYVNSDRSMSDVEEFEVMSNCTNHIISNSTFSWWAAWIAGHGITIAPDMFFGNDRIIPDNWIKVSVNSLAGR